MRQIGYTWRAALAAVLLAPGAAPASESGGIVRTEQTNAVRFHWEALLKNETGDPVSGNVRLTFGIFRGGSASAPDSGVLVYGETVEVTADEGKVAHLIGTGGVTFGALTPALIAGGMLSDAPDQVLWLQVSVGEGQTPLPRTRVTSVPFAAGAGDSQRLGGLPADAYAKISDVEKTAKEARATGSGGPTSTVGGGSGNDAMAAYSTVSGGRINIARAPYSTVAGGHNNLAWGPHASTIGGGESHYVAGRFAGVFSGLWNVALGTASVIGGGWANMTSDVPDANGATIAGGTENSARQTGTAIGGGRRNLASALDSTVIGGFSNTASGEGATVLGGKNNTASGDYSAAAGRRAQSTAAGAFTWADSQDADYTNSVADSFKVRARSGARIEAASVGDAFAAVNTGNGDVVNGYALGNGRAGFFRAENAAGLYASSVNSDGVQAASTALGTAAVRATASGGAAGVAATSVAGNSISANNNSSSLATIYAENNGSAMTISAVNSANGRGVRAVTEDNNAIWASSFTGGAATVYGTNLGVSGSAIWGNAANGFSLVGRNNSGTRTTLYTKNDGTGLSCWVDGRALVSGNLHVGGTLSKAGGSFKIDHPLAPDRKYLSHSFVESPDMKNIYDGTVTLDEQGSATVELPAYFEALNRDFRYQLTPVGGAASGLHVSAEVAANRFSIAGGNPGQKVCWQVTGTRKDPWAEGNRIVVEEEKPEGEVGTYLYPEGYGASRARSSSSPVPVPVGGGGAAEETDGGHAPADADVELSARAPQVAENAKQGHQE